MRWVNIIGAGLAGLSAAIELAGRGVGSRLISPQPSERAQSVLAEGGINAALDLMGERDTAEEHYADTMRAGAYLADPNAVDGLTRSAPELVMRLSSLGVPFQMEGRRLLQRHFGGQKKRRALYARSSTGKAVMTAMIDEARRYESAGLIRRSAHHTLAELDIAAGRCVGALVRDTRTGELWRFPGPVILCCGGLNGLFPGMTTGTTANTGEALAAVFSQGVELANLEFIQYHPTTVRIPDKRLLVSEAARGEGGHLFVERGGGRWYFMAEKYPELGDLMPRDVVSREMAALGVQAYLDLTELPEEVWRERLPDLRDELRRYLGADPANTPVPVSPGIHFFMGGAYVDEAHRTSMPGLWAAGECACQYHGANRLGGNSLLGALYGGAAAARSAGEDAEDGAPERVGVRSEPPEPPDIGGILSDGLGILRDAEKLSRALDALGAVEDAPRVRLGRAMLLSALAREESRGAHTRTDCPGRDDARFRKTTIAAYRGGGPEISFRDIPERRADG